MALSFQVSNSTFLLIIIECSRLWQELPENHNRDPYLVALWVWGQISDPVAVGSGFFFDGTHGVGL